MLPNKYISVFLLFQIVKGQNDTSTGTRSEVLSRKKRFLVFPEGSSFQLVFCVSHPLISPIGDIVFFGGTAALAWELPQDPYSPFMHHADPQHRRIDTKIVYFTDENGKVIFQKPYKKKLIVNPAFGKRSVDSHTDQIKNRGGDFKIYRKQMHASKNIVEFLDRANVEFHRSTRVSLYQKIETMLEGLGGNGKECLLKTLCIVGKTQNGSQGSFLEEILRATFTLPKGKSLSDEDMEDYDKAFSTTKPCEELYPYCPETIYDNPLSNEI